MPEPYRPATPILDLGDGFFDPVTPARFPKHILRFRNDRWSERVGLGGLDASGWENHFAKFEPLEDNLPTPLALRYHGHQFGSYNPNLGDGRGFLFAQLRSGDRLLDLGTKGSGRTPWSRGGDGRLTLKGGVREVLATEMLEAVGVNTSKTFSLFETGEALMRGDEPSPTRSSVLVRLNHSHIRFGSFQRLAYATDVPRLRKLLDFTLEQHFPGITTPLEFLREVTLRSARLCASFMIAGFVHGVLNSDNMNVTGESFDYGPYRFLPRYDADFTAAYFDHEGLYSFGRQPEAILRNVVRLGESLRPLEPADLTSAIAEYEPALGEAVRVKFLERLGIASSSVDEDAATTGAAFDFLEESAVGYDRFFFDWQGGGASEVRAHEGPAGEHYRGPAFLAFRRALDRHAPAKLELLETAYFKGENPCSLLIEEIEEIWRAIATRDDWAPFEAKIAAIRAMSDRV